MSDFSICNNPEAELEIAWGALILIYKSSKLLEKETKLKNVYDL